jgi:tripartite-type tricarboxylate transporter receptor subunit TctC
MTFADAASAMPQFKAGGLRPLASTGAKRLPELPEVPTLAEAGVAGVDVTQWYGLFAPARTPPDRVQALNRALNEVLADPAVVQLFERHGASVETGTPQMLGERVRADLARWQAVVAQGGLAVAEQRAAVLE